MYLIMYKLFFWKRGICRNIKNDLLNKHLCYMACMAQVKYETVKYDCVWADY